MENQHRQIKGYRDLSAAEIAAMNEVKVQGEALSGLIDQVQESGGDPRCIATARTQLQTGLMWLTRAIAKPAGF